MSNLTYILTIYGIIINVTGFAAMGIDKYKAKRQLWRISEKTLFTIAILGGSIGSSIGMYKFHHKTKHKSFVIGIPAIISIQIILLLLFYLKIMN